MSKILMTGTCKKNGRNGGEPTQVRVVVIDTMTTFVPGGDSALFTPEAAGKTMMVPVVTMTIVEIDSGFVYTVPAASVVIHEILSDYDIETKPGAILKEKEEA